MEFPYSVQVSSLQETIKVAEKFSRCIKPGDVVILNGSLGSGKTFFIRSVVKNLGVDAVSSPTFTLINEYTGIFNIYHFDFYRIKKPGELIDIGYYDYFNGNPLIFIEWGNLFPEMLPGKRIEINISLLPAADFNGPDFNRLFSINKYE